VAVIVTEKLQVLLVKHNTLSIDVGEFTFMAVLITVVPELKILPPELIISDGFPTIVFVPVSLHPPLLPSASVRIK